MKKRVFTIFFIGLVCISYAENVKKSVDNLRADVNDDIGDNDEAKDIAMDIPEMEPENKTRINLCSARRQNNNMHPILNATAKQFPFVAACLSLSDTHICSGTVIANGMILTTASCIQKQINAVLLNTIIAKRNAPGAERISVIKTEKFPSYTGEESLNDVGIVYTHKFNSSIASKVKLSNYTTAQNLVDVELFGFGLNEPSSATEQLQYVGVENRFMGSPGNKLNVFIDCIETKEPTCFTDYGGPAIFGNELVGVIVKGSPNCIQEISPNYAINKEMGTILPTFSFKAWVDEKIKNEEERNVISIPTFPQKLVGIEELKTKQSSAFNPVACVYTIFLLCMFPFYFH
ncbi:trypsin-like [Cydia fagiglandana]|uniref:trypsin-like n=1 Tax=Cydia fagiglandana TaxID=1458189 RepID=UPI002FEE2D1A